MPRHSQLKKGGRKHDMPTGVNTVHNQGDSTEKRKEDKKIENSPKADGAEKCVEEEEEGGSGQGDWEIILQTSEELLGQGFGGAEVKQNTEETGAKAKDVKARRWERGAPVKDERAGSGEAIATLTQGDYLQLLKLLKIKLPEGVVTEQVIELANTESSIQVAEDILQELEKLFIRFKAVPRLRCREVKRYLDLKEDGQLLQITKLIFFEKEDNKQKREEQCTKKKYTKRNKVEYGFLTGWLDFLARLRLKSGKLSDERLVIECKSTTGDMVGKVFTTKPKGVQAKINKHHEYSFQVQAYMYILNREAEGKQLLQMRRAVMVVRHYHQGGTPPRDFSRGYLQIDASVQEQIEQLRIFCQEQVLACYLALLNLIFQKETV